MNLFSILASFTLLMSKQIRFGVCLKLLELEVPSHKLVGEEASLQCKFDMEGDSLYSVKWYRNEQEFYRYVPNDRPKLQIFPQDGIRVERSKSSKHTVVLFDLQLEASGTYRCEVSAEAPSFRTKHQEKVMVVVQEPYHNEIQGLLPSYQVSDLVNVTCYSRGSSPPADLTWTVNGERIYDEKSVNSGQKHYNYHDPWMSSESVDKDRRQLSQTRYVYGQLKTWHERHHYPHLDTSASNLQFHAGENHRDQGLRLDCTASIGPVYWHSTQEVAVVNDRIQFTSWMSAKGDWLNQKKQTVFFIVPTIAVLVRSKIF